MILKTILISTLSYLVLNNGLYAQNQDIEKLKNLFPTSKVSLVSEKSKNNTNEVQMVFSGLYIFYKNVFSSQDSKKCNFHLSCSDYGINSIKSHGVKGVFLTFDRLTRCNGLNRKRYPIIQKNGLLYDPVQEDSLSINFSGKIINL
jgi:uncharacterized protein